MANHSSILTWRIPWTKEPDGLWSKHKELDMPERSQHSTHINDADKIISPEIFFYVVKLKMCALVEKDVGKRRQCQTVNSC